MIKRIKNLIAVIVLFLTDIFFLLYFRSYFWFVMIILLAGIVVYSLITAFIVFKRVRIAIKISKEEVERNGNARVHFFIKNESLFAIPSITLKINMGNRFYNDKKEIKLEGYTLAKQEVALDMDILCNSTGVFEISVDGFEMTDLLSLVLLKNNKKICSEIFYVMPHVENLNLDASYDAKEEGEEENILSKTGNTNQEIIGVNEYKPGDNIKLIHHKLSALKDEWMIKELASSSSKKVVLLTDINKEFTSNNIILDAYISVAEFLYKNSVPFMMGWYENEQLFYTEIIMSEDIKRTVKNLLLNAVVTEEAAAYNYYKVDANLKKYGAIYVTSDKNSNFKDGHKIAEYAGEAVILSI